MPFTWEIWEPFAPRPFLSTVCRRFGFFVSGYLVGLQIQMYLRCVFFWTNSWMPVGICVNCMLVMNVRWHFNFGRDYLVGKICGSIILWTRVIKSTYINIYNIQYNYKGTAYKVVNSNCPDDIPVAPVCRTAFTFREHFLD